MFGLQLKCDLALQYPRAEGYHADKSCKPRPLVILLATQAFVVRACEEDAVAVALGVALANNDVAVAVNLCCVHVHSPLLWRAMIC